MGHMLPHYVEGGPFWLSRKEGAKGSSGLKLYKKGDHLCPST